MKHGRYFGIALLLAWATQLYAQQHPVDNLRFKRKNNLQFEFSTIDVPISLRYERVLINGVTFKTFGNAGLFWGGLTRFKLPMGISELRSFGSHHIEFGLGYAYERPDPYYPYFDSGNASYTRSLHTVNGLLGYRYQKPDGNLILRTGAKTECELRKLQPVFSIGGYLSVGYCF